MNDLETRLSSMLDQRAERSPQAPEIDTVINRARRIKRRRTAATAAGVAAAVALAIGVPYAALDHPNAAPPPAQKSKAPRPRPDGLVSPHFDKLPTGHAPTIGYLQGTVYHSASGEKVKLPPLPRGADDMAYQSVSRLGNGWLIARQLTAKEDDSTATSMITVYDESFKEIFRTQGNGVFATSRDGSQVAWWTNDQKIHVAGVKEGLSSERTMSTVPNPSWMVEPVGIRDDGSVVYSSRAVDLAPSYHIAREGKKTINLTSHLELTGYDEVGDRLVGRLSEVSGSTVSSVSDPGTPLWSTQWRLFDFSPDGTRVLGQLEVPGEEGVDGVGPCTLRTAVFDAQSGKMLHEVPDPASYQWMGQRFESDNSVILVLSDLNAHEPTETLSSWTLARLTPEGKFERAAPIEGAPNADPPFGLGHVPSYVP